MVLAGPFLGSCLDSESEKAEMRYARAMVVVVFTKVRASTYRICFVSCHACSPACLSDRSVCVYTMQ